MITEEEYLKSKRIVEDYKSQQIRLSNSRVASFKLELEDYFKKKLIDGLHQIEQFKLNETLYGTGTIIPIKPSLEESYEGGNNDDIRKICEKHDVDFKIIYWCYHK